MAVDTAIVKIWGMEAGVVIIDPVTSLPRFEYFPEFIRTGLELSPLRYGLSDAPPTWNRYDRVLSHEAFDGLPGFIADALPDKFGRELVTRYLNRHGRSAEDINPVERLLYQGPRGMGALEFVPDAQADLNDPVNVGLSGLVAVAAAVLNRKEAFHTNLAKEEEALLTILKFSSSAGGSRAKALIAYNEKTGEVLSGQTDAPDGFEQYLIKFDGVDSGEFTTPQHYGSLEYSYYRMALACGIDMMECRLYPDGDWRHFMTRRFDRRTGGEKVHMVSLCGMQHLDFNEPRSHSYEELFMTILQMNLGYRAVEQAYRRMVFNVVGRNQDDHTKNFAFLMDKNGQWRLSPAFDMTYSYKPSSRFVAKHQMSVGGKYGGDEITREDLVSVGKAYGVKKAEKILEDIVQVFREVDSYLEGDLPDPMVQEVRSNIVYL